jgi:RNA-binding protein YlmH
MKAEMTARSTPPNAFGKGLPPGVTPVDENLLPHLDDLARKAVRQGRAASDFLTPEEQTLVTRHFARRRDVALSFEGGFPGALRTIAVLREPEWGGVYDPAELLACVKIAHRSQDETGHRDILGALMALGLERRAVGDIVTGGPPEYFLCRRELLPVFLGQLTQIGRTGVTLTEVPLSAIPVRTETIRQKTVSVSSPRLDTLVADGFGLAREKAASLIEGGLVAVNHTPCEKPDRHVSQGDLLALRGRGQVKILSVGGLSRKGRLFIELGIYE